MTELAPAIRSGEPTQPSGHVCGFGAVENLVHAAWAQVRRGGDPPNGQPGLTGRADGPGSFDLCIGEMDGRRPQAVHKLLLTSDALVERFTCFHWTTIKRRCWALSRKLDSLAGFPVPFILDTQEEQSYAENVQERTVRR